MITNDLRKRARSNGVLGWFEDPSDDRGLRFARRRGEGWDFCSYRRLRDLSVRMVARLRAVGVGRGDVVMLSCPTSLDFVVGFFGALLAGATPSPIAPPTGFKNEEGYRERLAWAARAVMPRAFVTLADMAPGLAEVASSFDCAVLTDVLSEEDSDGAPADGYEVPLPEIALIQFSSGSTGAPRGVRISLDALNANVSAIHQWLNYTESDSLATWLPLYHDMGLIGCLLGPMAAGTDVSLMPPEQFIRSPIRWLNCFADGGATTTATPTFGLSHVLQRTRPEQLEDMSFSGWRTLIIGAERVDPTVVNAFLRLVEPRGFNPHGVLPAYGLAEATLAVTGSTHRELVRTITVDSESLRFGQVVDTASSTATGQTLVGCGRPLPGMRVEIVDEERRPVAERVLGEVVVTGPSISEGYVGGPDSTGFGGVLRTGDAGFMHDDELFVVGRVGDSIKQFGRWLFAEDVERVASQASRPPSRIIALLGDLAGQGTVAVVVEGPSADAAARIGPVVANHVPHARVLMLAAPAGWVNRTTSGKPMRRVMWEKAAADGHGGAAVLWDSVVARIDPAWLPPT